MPVLLALLSRALWGTADFMGGTLTRRISPFVVVGWSQAAGLVTAGLIVLVAPGLMSQACSMSIAGKFHWFA